MSGNRIVKSGELKLNKSGLLSNKWQQKYCVLLRPEDKNPAVLEIAENATDYQADKKKDMSLDGVVSIESVQKFKEHPHAFEVHLKRDKHIFAVDDEGQLHCWVEAFRQACGVFKQAPEIFGIEENTLYESADQNLTYTVDILEAKTANDMGLKGQHNFVVGLTEVSLYDVNKRMEVCRLPLSKIRRYGILEEGVLYMETGRQCSTGEGHFRFATHSAYVIAQLMRSRSAQLDRSPSSGLSDSCKNQNITPGSHLSSSGKKVNSLENITQPRDQSNVDIKHALERKLSSDLKKKEDKKKKSSKEEQKKSAKELKSSKEEQSKSTKDKKKDKKSQDKSKQKVLPDLVKVPESSPIIPQEELRCQHTYEDVEVSDANTPQTAPVESATYSQTYSKPDITNRQRSTPCDKNLRFKPDNFETDMYSEVGETVKPHKPLQHKEQIYDEPDEFIKSDRGKIPVHPPKPIPIPRNISQPGTRHELVYDEPDEYVGPIRKVNQEETAEVLYDQIDTDFNMNTSSSRKQEEASVVYSQPNKVKNAWREKGRSGEVHEEHYEAIKSAAESGNTKPVNTIHDDADDNDIYNQLAFATRDSKPRIKHISSPEDNTYAHVTSYVEGDQKNGMTYENYDSVTVRSGSCSQDEVQRSSGGSNSSGYAEFVK